MFQKLRSVWQEGGIGRFGIIVAVLFVLCMIPTLRGISEENDFNIFFSAANALRQGHSMYDGPHLYGMWYYYSPLFAALLVPFTFFPLPVLKLAWLFFSLFMLYRIAWLFFRYLKIPDSPASRWFIALLAVTAVHAVFLNLLHGQMTILVLWCCMEGSWQALNRKYMKGAAAFGIGINVKLLPVFFFYSYFLKGNIRMLLWMGAATICFVLLPYLFLPASFHTELLRGWSDMINPFKAEHINTVGEGGFIDFASIVTKYFTDAAISTEAQLNFTNLTEYEVFLAQTAFRLIILACVAWMLLRVHKPFAQPQKEFADLAFVLLCIPSAFPHQRDYSILMCLPAFAMLLYSWFISGYRPGKLMVALVIIAVMAMGSLMFLELLGHRMRVFIYETRLNGLGALLFIPLYMLWMRGYSRSLIQPAQAVRAA